MAYRPNKWPRFAVAVGLAPVALIMLLFGLYVLWGTGVGL
jgi:hypothetical protein